MANIIRRNDRESRDVSSRSGTSYFDPYRLVNELLRWEPFSANERLGGGGPLGGFLPAVDIRETADSYVFRADLPGVKEEDLDISVTGNRLTISGHREEDKTSEGERCHSYECSYGSFSRAFMLPEGTDPEKVRADLKGGVLSVTVPKRPEVQPRKITVGGPKAPSGQPRS